MRPRDGHAELEPDTSRVVVLHARHDALAGRQELRDDADVVLRDVDEERLHRLHQLAVLLASDDRRLRDLQLVALAAHGLDQHGELELAAAGDPQRVGRAGLLDPQAHVLARLGKEPLADLPRRHVLTLAAAPRRRVDAEDHGDGRLLDPDRRERHRVLAVGDRVANADLVDAADREDVAGARARDFFARETEPRVEQGELARQLGAVGATERVLTAGDELPETKRPITRRPT
mgnify:CR=1 FL=1